MSIPLCFRFFNFREAFLKLGAVKNQDKLENALREFSIKLFKIEGKGRRLCRGLECQVLSCQDWKHLRMK